VGEATAPEDGGVKYRLNEPLIDEADIAAVLEVMQSGWIGQKGKYTKELEQEWAGRLGMAGAVAVQSGTAATHVALAGVFDQRRADEWWRGGHVAVADFSCSAPGAMTVLAGGTPHFVDVDRETLGVRLDELERVWSTTPLDAVVLVHVYGAPARDSLLIRDWCAHHEVHLIEDACEAHGATYEDGTPVGSIGDVALFSLRSEKVIGVGEGGVAMAQSQSLYERMEFYANRGKPRDDGWVWRFYTSAIGMNYRLPHLLGAFGLSQLAKMDGFVQRRRQIAAL
jgi:perosamine synthetase